MRARLPPLPREGRRGDSPGDCGTGTHCPCQGHTVHTGFPSPRHGPPRCPARAEVSSAPQTEGGQGQTRPRHPLSAPAAPLSAPTGSPGALAAILTSAPRGLLGTARGAAGGPANAGPAAAPALWPRCRNK